MTRLDAVGDRFVRIVEVGPRDGLQNESAPVDVALKVALIERLVAAGLREIEAGSFVSPRWVPRMADSAEVFARIPRGQARYSALVPNRTGLAAALAARADEVAVFAAATESFSQRNINCSVAESLERFRPVVAEALAAGVPVRGYVSCVLDCPFEGPTDPARVAEVALRLAELGCHTISLGDTIGRGTPDATRRLIEACGQRLALDRLAGHFHDTWGMAVANVLAALELGLREFDASVAGLGGCPYAPGATGNVATEDVVHLLHGLGYQTGIDADRLAETGAFISDALGRPNASRAGRARRASCSSGGSPPVASVVRPD